MKIEEELLSINEVSEYEDSVKKYIEECKKVLHYLQEDNKIILEKIKAYQSLSKNKTWGIESCFICKKKGLLGITLHKVEFYTNDDKENE